MEKKTQKREACASAQARISVVRSQLLLYPNSPSLQLQKRNLSMLLPKTSFAIVVDNRDSAISKSKTSQSCLRCSISFTLCIFLSSTCRSSRRTQKFEGGCSQRSLSVKFVHKEEGGQFQAERAWRTIHAQSRTDSSKKPFCI
jgi:hypothetical protein